MSDTDDPIPLDEAAVPSHGTLFDDPDSSPPVVSPRLANADRGRLYRSAHAAGPLADAAIMALPRTPDVDPALPQSPEILAAEQAATAAAQREAEERARAADEAARAAQAAALAAAEAAALAERARAEAQAPGVEPSAISETPEPSTDSPVTPPPAATPPVDAPPTAGPVTDAAVAAALGLLPPPGTPPAVSVSAAVIAPSAATPEPGMVTAIPAASESADAAITPAAVLPAGRRALPRITWTQAAILITGVTILFGLIDVVMRHSIGTLTGIGLILSTIAAALLVQRDDIWVAVVVPPLAFFAALVTAGQLAVGGTGSFISRQALNIVTGLSINAPWILGATAIGLVIVLVRRRRSPRPAMQAAPADVNAEVSA